MKIYNAIQGDTWDSVAKKTLGNEYAMTALLNANADKVHIRIFKGGERLNIPETKTVEPTITPPWGKLVREPYAGSPSQAPLRVEMTTPQKCDSAALSLRTTNRKML